MAKKVLKENSIVQIGNYQANINQNSVGWYLSLPLYYNKQNSILFEQFGINKTDLVNKFNLNGFGVFPNCDTLKKLTEVIEYLQSLSNIGDELVFGKFPIGSIVISLKDMTRGRKKGDIFKVLENSSATRLFYKEKQYSSTYHKFAWRKATKKEEEAYKNGIKNIKEIEYELVSLDPETDYFIVKSQKKYSELLDTLKTNGYNVYSEATSLTVTDNWKYVIYNHLERYWVLDCELLGTHKRKISLDLCKILEEEKETNDTQVNSKPINKLIFNHKNKKRSKIKLSAL